MSSAIERVAEQTRALATSSTSVQVTMLELASTTNDLVATAQRLGRDGAHISKLVALLAAAESSIKGAAHDMEQFGVTANAVADRLAGQRSGASALSHCLHAVQGLAVTVAMVAEALNPAWSSSVAIADLNNHDPKAATELIAHAAAGGEIQDAAREPDYEVKPQVKDPDQAEYRPKP